MLRVGLISDTHDLLRPEATAFLAGCDHIIHAGDITSAEVLEGLARLAPLTAVRGNNDRGAWAKTLRETERITLGGVTLYAIHDLARLDLDPQRERIDVVISGHSHRAAVRERDGVLYVNPGSAGPRRFRLPVSAGQLTIAAGAASARIVDLLEP